MPLHDGQNEICFRVGRERQRAFVHVIPWSARLVVSDVDGTITRSAPTSAIHLAKGWQRLVL